MLCLTVLSDLEAYTCNPSFLEEISVSPHPSTDQKRSPGAREGREWSSLSLLPSEAASPAPQPEAENGCGSSLECFIAESLRDTAVARRLPEGSLPWLSHYFLLISVTHPEGCWP